MTFNTIILEQIGLLEKDLATIRRALEFPTPVPILSEAYIRLRDAREGLRADLPAIFNAGGGKR
jgi:hypothetical protein